MKNMNVEKRNKIIKVLGLVGLFVLVFGLSYALFRITLTGRKKTRIKTANFNIELLDKNNNSIVKNSNNQYEYEINIDNALPTDDEEGLEQEGFIFKLRNSGNIGAKYTIYLDDVELTSEENRLGDQYIKYSLTKNESIGTPSLLSTLDNRKLDTGIINNGTTNTYTLKIWIDESATIEASNKVFEGVLRVEAEQYISKMKIQSGTFADTLVKQGIVDSITQLSINGFDSNTEEDGLYDYTDEEGTETYVYRGQNPNNYVTFAGSTWRVLRIQEDGTVKLIKEDALNFESDKVESNGNGYMQVRYNINDDSSIQYRVSNVKAYLEEWYESTMQDYDNKIVTNDYCSDTTEDHNSTYYKMISQNENVNLYGIYNRIYFGDWDGEGNPTAEQMNSMTIKPSVSCRTNDKLSLKVALITADEAVTLGSAVTTTAQTYLTKDYDMWTLSPSIDMIDYNRGVAYRIYNGLVANADSSYGAVHPVITLNKNTTVTSGNGTSESPYIIQ